MNREIKFRYRRELGIRILRRILRLWGTNESYKEGGVYGYSIDGRSVSKDQYDKYMKDQPND